MYIRAKRIKGHTYFYLVKSERHGKKVKQIYIGYLGKTGGLRQGSQTGGNSSRERTPTGLEALAVEARRYKSARKFVEKMQVGVLLNRARLPDALRVPMEILTEARRHGTFYEIDRAKKLMEQSIHTLNLELKGKPFGPLYKLNNAGKVVFSAVDFTGISKNFYQPKFFGKPLWQIQPREAAEFIAKIEEQIRQRAISPIGGAEQIQLLEEVRTNQTLAKFHKQVWQKMIEES